MYKAKERIESLKKIMQRVERDFIKNQAQYNISKEYEYLGEVITLYAKQHNLIESTIILLNQNMNEEALILARSVVSNYFLIGYLLDDDKNCSRLKKYQRQPLIADLYYWKNIRNMLNGEFGKRMKETCESVNFSLEDVDETINNIRNEIVKAGGSRNERLLSVKDTAEKCDKRGFDIYVTHYAFSSKFEHCDISSLNIYKDALEKNEDGTKFLMNLNVTDEKLCKCIMAMIYISYVESFRKISEVLLIKEKELIENYDVKAILDLCYDITNMDKEIGNDYRGNS